MAQATDLRKGVRVSWNTSQGRIHGVVVRKAMRRLKIEDFEIAATPQRPRFVVKSDKSGKLAAHAASALNILKKH